MLFLVPALIRRRYLLLGVAAVLGVAAALVGRQLSLDRSIHKMFADGDPILAPYDQLQRTFGEHDIVLAVYQDPEFATPAGLVRIEQLADSLRGVEGVAAVVSLLDLPAAAEFLPTGPGAKFREVFSGYTHNQSLTAAGVICLIERPSDGDAARQATLDAMRRVIADYPEGVLVGEPVLIEEAFDLLEADGVRLNTWCTILVLLTILACFRRLRWAVLPLVVVQLALAATRATLVLLDLQLSMVSSMLAAIVTVIGVATVVHVIVRYLEAREEGLGPQEALTQTLRRLAMPIAFTCLTDMAGFASLMISDVGPVYDFGQMMAIGSLWVFPCVMIVTPALVLWRNRRPESTPTADARLSRTLAAVLSGARRHAALLGLAGGAAAITAMLGIGRLERETVFTKNFRADSPLVESYEFVEEEFGGAGVWEMLIPAPRPLTRNYVLRVLKFTKILRREAPQLTKAISLTDALDAGADGLVRRRLAGDLAVRAGLGVLRQRLPEFVDATLNDDPATGKSWLRIMLRAPERLDAAEKTALIERVSGLARQVFPESETTGYYVLLNALIESVLADQWKAFGIAAAAILAMMTAAFRNFWFALAAMLPNALPVLVLFGAMGWLGIRINMGAAMIAAVSVGLSVDGSIHYVLDYRRLRRGGLAPIAALNEVQQTVGRAASFATLALCVGFATLAVSDFVPTIYFGILVSLSMIGGLAGNLIVLPVALGWIDRG